MYEDDKWRIYERRNIGSPLRYTNTMTEYKPTKHSTPVQVTATATATTIAATTTAKIYIELGAEVITYAELPAGPIKSFDQLIAFPVI